MSRANHSANADRRRGKSRLERDLTRRERETNMTSTVLLTKEALDAARSLGRAARAAGQPNFCPFRETHLVIAWQNGWHEPDGCPVCGYALMECACPITDPFAVEEPADVLG